MTKETGGPAFPRMPYIVGQIGSEEYKGGQTGMTLRDYFAAHAPEPPEWYMQEATGELGIPVWTAFYKWRWEYANAMLATRKDSDEAK